MLFKDAEGIRMRDIAFAVVAVAVAVGVNVNVSVSRTHLCVTGSHFNGCLIAWPVPGLIEREGSEREQEREGGGGWGCVTSCGSRRRDTFMDIATFCVVLRGKQQMNNFSTLRHLSLSLLSPHSPHLPLSSVCFVTSLTSLGQPPLQWFCYATATATILCFFSFTEMQKENFFFFFWFHRIKFVAQWRRQGEGWGVMAGGIDEFGFWMLLNGSSCAGRVTANYVDDKCRSSRKKKEEAKRENTKKKCKACTTQGCPVKRERLQVGRGMKGRQREGKRWDERERDGMRGQALFFSFCL